MRIRVDGGYSYFEDTFEAAPNRLDWNKTRAVLGSCEVVGDSFQRYWDCIRTPGLSLRVRSELAEVISTRRVDIATANLDALVNLG